MIPNSQPGLVTTDQGIKDWNCPLSIEYGSIEDLGNDFSVAVGREIWLEEVMECMGGEEVETGITVSSFKEFC